MGFGGGSETFEQLSAVWKDWVVGEEARTDQEELGSDPDPEGEYFSGFWGVGTCPTDTPNCQYEGIPVDDELAREQESGDTMSGSFSANDELYKQSRTKSGKVRLEGVLLLKRLRDKGGKFTSDWAACDNDRRVFAMDPTDRKNYRVRRDPKAVMVDFKNMS